MLRFDTTDGLRGIHAQSWWASKKNRTANKIICLSLFFLNRNLAVRTQLLSSERTFGCLFNLKEEGLKILDKCGQEKKRITVLPCDKVLLMFDDRTTNSKISRQLQFKRGIFDSVNFASFSHER